MDEKGGLEEFRAGIIRDEKAANHDKILNGVVIYMFVTLLFYRAMPLLFADWYSVWFFPYLNFVLNICWSFIPLLLARNLKNDKLRQTGLIIGSIYMIISLGFGLKETISTFL